MRNQFTTRNRFLGLNFLLIVGLILFSGCSLIQPEVQTPVTTLPPSPVPSEPTQTSQATATVGEIGPTEPAVVTAQPTDSLPTTGGTPTPVLEIIDPGNVSGLQTVEQVSPVQAQTFAWADENQVLALVTENQVSAFNVASETLEAQLSDQSASQLTSLPGESLVAWAAQDHSVHVWNQAEDKEVTTITENSDPISALALTPDGQQVVAATTENQLKVWDVAAGQTIQTCDLSTWLSQLAVSPEGSQIAGVDAQAFTVRFYDQGTCEEIRSLSWTESASPALYGAYFSPDWKTLAWVARGTVQTMDVGTGALGPQMSHEDFVNGVAWSPDGRLLATAAAATIDGNFSPAIFLWDAASGQLANTLVLNSAATSLSFSPDGSQLAVLLSGGNMQLWAVTP